MAEKLGFNGLWGIPRLVMTEDSIALAREDRPLTMELTKQVSQGEPCKALLIEVRRSAHDQYLPLAELVKNRPEGLDYMAWFMTHADKGRHRAVILHDNLDASGNWGTLKELNMRYALDCLNIDPGFLPHQWLEETILITHWLADQERNVNLSDTFSFEGMQ